MNIQSQKKGIYERYKHIKCVHLYIKVHITLYSNFQQLEENTNIDVKFC